MLAQDLKEVFEAVVEGRLEQAAWQQAVYNQDVRPKLDQLKLVSKIRKVPVEVLLDLPIILCKIAFVQPQLSDEILDRVAKSWQANWSLPLPELPAERHELPSRLWNLFWEHIETPGSTALFDLSYQFPDYLDDQLRARYGQAMLEKNQANREAILESLNRPDFTLDSLRDYPEGTFGYAFYHHMVDHNLTLEAMDTGKFSQVNDSVEFIRKRYLQTHDIWHVVLGYGVKPYEEVALQLVNIAQAGGAYPAYITTVTTTSLLFFNPSQMTYLFDLAMQSWLHGRRTPPLLPIKWEAMWHLPLSEVREHYGISTKPDPNNFLYR